MRSVKLHLMAGAAAALLILGAIVIHQDLRDQAKADHVEHIASTIAGAIAPHQALPDSRGAAVTRPAKRVSQLPQDAGYWQIDVVTCDSASTSSPDLAGRSLLYHFESNARLKRLKSQCHFWHGWPGLNAYDYRVGASFNYVTPGVALLRSDGLVIYKASGAELPATAEELADQLEAAVEVYKEQLAEQAGDTRAAGALDRFRYRFDEQRPDCDRCPKPNPTPDKTPVQQPAPAQPVPDYGVPKQLPHESELSTGACLGIAAAIALVLFLVIRLRGTIGSAFGG